MSGMKDGYIRCLSLWPFVLNAIRLVGQVIINTQHSIGQHTSSDPILPYCLISFILPNTNNLRQLRLHSSDLIILCGREGLNFVSLCIPNSLALDLRLLVQF